MYVQIESALVVATKTSTERRWYLRRSCGGDGDVQLVNMKIVKGRRKKTRIKESCITTRETSQPYKYSNGVFQRCRETVASRAEVACDV
jgi:hypothetical protein